MNSLVNKLNNRYVIALMVALFLFGVFRQFRTRF